MRSQAQNSKGSFRNSTEKLKYKKLKVLPSRIQFTCSKSKTGGKFSNENEYMNTKPDGINIKLLNTTQNCGSKVNSRSGYRRARNGIYSVDLKSNQNMFNDAKNGVQCYADFESDVKPQFENIKILKSSEPATAESKLNAIYTIPIREYVELPANRNNQRQVKEDSSRTFSTINTHTDFNSHIINVRSKNISTKNDGQKKHNFNLKAPKLKMRGINSKASSRVKKAYLPKAITKK
jgi:hypothetical protein